MFDCGPKFLSVYRTFTNMRCEWITHRVQHKMFKSIHNCEKLCECSKLIYPRIFVVWQRFKYLCVVWNILNTENYRQLPARLHLISATCELLTHQMFVFNWHFACLFALSVDLGFKISLLVACFLVCRHIQRIQQLVFFKILVCYSERSWPSHLPPKKPGFQHRVWMSHFTLDYMEKRTYVCMYRRFGRKWRHNQPKFLALMGLPKYLSFGAPHARASGARRAPLSISSVTWYSRFLAWPSGYRYWEK